MGDERIGDTNGLEPAPPGELARRLERDRPAPSPSFQLGLRRSLLEPPALPPARLRLWIAACAGSGTVLLGLVAIGLAGIGPLAPG